MLDNLINWEREHGFKSKFVAEKLGLTPAAYTKIKRGEQRPTVEMAERLQTEFNVSDPFVLLKNYNEVK